MTTDHVSDEQLLGRTARGTVGFTDEVTDPITLVGLVLEAASGLRRVLTPNITRDLGVGGLAFEILLRLVRSDGGRLRMSDLSAQTGLTPSGLTRAVDRLVEAGFVERAACPSDRRGAFASLTELGAARAAHALARHERETAELLAGVLDPDEEAQLAALLRRLRDRVHPDAALVSSSD
jgi:DNA-binding MarR family transcriptional regulator